jgi:hypothetical protein
MRVSSGASSLTNSSVHFASTHFSGRTQTHRHSKLVVNTSGDRLLDASFMSFSRGGAFSKSTYQTNEPVPSYSIKANLIRKAFNSPLQHVGWDTKKSLYPAEPVNFSPLRPVLQGVSTIDRAARETPWESRFDILNRRIFPRFMSQCTGTPRREYQAGMVEGIRIRASFNPYFEPSNQKLRQWNTWRSRDFETWDPMKVSVRGSMKTYEVPGDLIPFKDELGETHPPLVSSRYQADVKRQYILNGLPWIFDKDFMESKRHIRDREPLGIRRWYRREFKLAKIRESMKAMPQQIEEYRKDRRLAKRNTWFEKVVTEMAGEHACIRKPKFRKL